MPYLLSFPKSGGLFLITGWEFPAQCGQNDFDHDEGKKPEVFIIGTGASSSQLWLADRFHKNFYMPLEVKRVIDHIIEMKLITILAHYIFVGDGYLQHGAASCPGAAFILYHMCLIPKGHKLLDVFSFAYGGSFRKACDPILPISSVFEVPTVPKVQPTSASSSHN